jgi:hypothetical protein
MTMSAALLELVLSVSRVVALKHPENERAEADRRAYWILLEGRPITPRSRPEYPPSDSPGPPSIMKAHGAEAP